jgi:hypothetical protein
MKKPPQQSQSQVTKKIAGTAKSKSFNWSAEKSAALRKAAAFPSGGDCNCNCGK